MAVGGRTTWRQPTPSAQTETGLVPFGNSTTLAHKESHTESNTCHVEWKDENALMWGSDFRGCVRQRERERVKKLS